MKSISMPFAAAVAVFAAGAAHAQDSQVIQLGDQAMSCPQIVGAAAEAAEIIGGAPEGGVFASEWAINAGTGVIQHGALMGGAARAIPGIGFLGGIAANAARRQREEHEARQVVMRQRWYYLNGLYAGRDCDRVLREAAAEPAAE